MKAFILVSDCARMHPDGTFSLLRGGIDRVHAPKTQPIQFRGSFLARIQGDMTEAGEHSFSLKVLNEDGEDIAPEISGSFSVPQGGGAGLIALDFGMVLPGYGRYTFALTVDRHRLDSWEVRALPADPPPARREN